MKINQRFFATAKELDAELREVCDGYQSILDLGSGIRPFELENTSIHVCVDAHANYLEYLNVEKPHQKRVYLVGKIEELITKFPNNSIDLVVALDVIEHMSKIDGAKLVLEMERVARRGTLIFTPLGFMPQHLEDSRDAWGLDGGKWQEHLSGWEPGDIEQISSGWKFFICKNYHEEDSKKRQLNKVYGAFYAYKEKTNKIYNEYLTKIEMTTQLYSHENLTMLATFQNQIKTLSDQIGEMESSSSWKITKPLRWLSKTINGKKGCQI